MSDRILPLSWNRILQLFGVVVASSILGPIRISGDVPSRKDGRVESWLGVSDVLSKIAQ